MKRKHDSSGLVLAVLLVIAVFVSQLNGCGNQPPKEPQLVPETVTSPAEMDVKTKAVSVFQELLRTYPALEGEHPELEDPSFGYEENLAKFGQHYDWFMLSDLNRDDVPELIVMTVINKRWTPVSVFRYDASTGEAVLLKAPADPGSQATFEQMSTAGGAYSLYICKDNHIHSLWGGDTPVGYQEENCAYVLTGNGLEAVECGATAGEGNSARFAELALQNTEANRNAIA